MKSKTYRKTVQAAAALICSGSIAISALADSPAASEPYVDGPTSNLWLSVVELPSQARISVTVPTSYGFAVVGSVNSADNGAVTSQNGTVLLSNVRVEVTSSADGTEDGAYTITEEGLPEVTLENRSTDVRDEYLDQPEPPREGLPVEVQPYVVEIPDTLLDGVTGQHHWKPIGADPTGDRQMFKRYRMGIAGKWFEAEGTVTDGKKNYDAYFLNGKLPLPAPPDVQTGGWTTGGAAKEPSISHFDVDVQVGGVQNQYDQVEQSVKIGQIGWEIIPGELPEHPVS